MQKLLSPISARKNATTVVEPGWRAATDPALNLILERTVPLPARTAMGTDVDPIMLEVFNSRFMACAEQMGEALLVNPYSREELSDAIQKALTMPLAERIRKWEALMDVVRATDVGIWRDDFVRALQADESTSQPTQWAGAA